MSGHVSLKWNNHSSSLLRSLTKVRTKEQYCDVTIACQGKYFPVHRIVLSTCSEYFEEIFERIQNQHPYIIFKDIEPREMELLLNYMYQGEVNVLQENLPMLMKAAEALKIKGLSVHDDVPVKEPPTTKKRSSNSNDYPHAKKRPEEKRRRRESNEGHSSNKENDESYSTENYAKNLPKTDHSEELKVIKEEPVDTSYEDNDLSKTFEIPITEGKIEDSNNEMQDFTCLENVNFAKDGNIAPNEPFENQVIKEEPVDTSYEDNDLSKTFEIPITEVKIEDSNNEMQDFTSLENVNFVKDGIIAPNEPFENQSSSSWSTYNEGDQVGNLSAQDDIDSGSGYEEERNLDLSFSSSHVQRAIGAAFKTCRIPNAVPLKHSCSICPYKTKKKGHLQQHTKVKHLNSKPFACTICGSSFGMKNDLSRHTLTHTGVKPHQCPRCGKGFIRKDRMMAHLRNCNRECVQ